MPLQRNDVRQAVVVLSINVRLFIVGVLLGGAVHVGFGI
jgi:hypothetical protein